MKYVDGAPGFSNFVTCFTHLRYAGLYLDGSLANYVKICIPVLFLITGTLSFAIAIIFHFNDRTTIWLIENGHWCIVYVTVVFLDIQMGINTKTILGMSRAVKSGVYRYEQYETADRLMLENMNARVLTFSRVFGVVYLVAVMGTLVKSALLEEYEPYKHFYNTWFPFEINSVYRVNIVRAYELGCACSAASGAYTFFLTFMTYAYHIEAQLQLLLQKLKRIFDPIGSDSKMYSQQVDFRIRECLGHHRAILRLFNNFSEFCNPLVGCSTLMSTFMFCTLLYLITNPDFDVSVIITFSSVVAPEFSLVVSFRIRGQKITDLSSEVNKTIYELDWLEQDVKLRKDLLMWLRLTSKPLELKAFGYRNVSHAGIKDVLQTSYTFFNMLKAST